MGITNDEFENFRLTFSRCENRGVTLTFDYLGFNFLPTTAKILPVLSALSSGIV